MFAKRIFITGMVAILAVLFVACGSDTSNTGSTGGNTPPATATPTTAATSTTAATPTPATNTDALIKTAQVTISGKQETVLTNAQGMTLYYLTTDSATKVTCTGGCAGTWPPVIFTGSGVPTAATALPAKLTVFQNGNGNQVEYNGHPLYTYAGDSAAGQVTGEGVGGVWYAMRTEGYGKDKY